MLLMIDNYDSFTYNLVQYLGELGAEVRVFRNDEIDLAGIAALAPAQIVISPGPCTPNEAGISVEAIKTFAGRIPLLGVCLGHQAIGQAFGGRILRAVIWQITGNYRRATGIAATTGRIVSFLLIGGGIANFTDVAKTFTGIVVGTTPAGQPVAQIPTGQIAIHQAPSLAKGAEIGDDGVVTITIALTTSGCPLRAQIQKDVRARVGSIPGVSKVKITWSELTQEEKAAAMAKARQEDDSVEDALKRSGDDEDDRSRYYSDYKIQVVVVLAADGGSDDDCDDDNVCTDDSCDEINDLIVNAPNDANCDNGL